MKILKKILPNPLCAIRPIEWTLKRLTLAGLALTVSSRAQASLVVYEGFSYPAQSDNAALASAAFNGGIGLSGTWAGSGKYRTAGLSFSDIAVAGGCAQGANAEIYYRKLNVNQTGTIWGSFLFKSVSAVDTTTNLSSFVVSKKANGNDWQIETNFGVTPKRYNGTNADIRLGGNTNPPDVANNTGGVAVAQNTTYLVLFKIQSLTPSGGGATSQTLTSWILSAAQYDNFKSGGLTEAELNAASQGAGAANVMQKTTLTATQKASFSVNDYVTLQSNNVGDYMHDEIRFSDASLAEVAPSTGALVWNLPGGGIWDTSTVNWKDQASGVTMAFANGKNVIFDNTAGGTINLAPGVSPASTNVSSTSGTYTFNGILGGAGPLIKSNDGVLFLNGVNTYTGGTVINSGLVTCSLSNPYPLGAKDTINVTVQSGATLELNRNQFIGTLTLNGGKVLTGNGWGDDAWNGSIVLGATSTVDVGATDGCFNMNAVVTGPGGLIKLGTTNRPTPLNGANTFTGPISVQAGALQGSSLNRIVNGTTSSSFGAPTTVESGTISLGANDKNGTLSYSGPGETTDRVIKLAGTTGSATISQGGTGSGFPTTRGESGLLRFTSDIAIPGVAGVDNSKTLILSHGNSLATGNSSGSGEISGSIGDSVLGIAGKLATSVTKSNFGIWKLSGVNTYRGATKVQGGTLIFSRPLALGEGPLDITAGAKVQLDYIGTRQISALTFDAGAVKPNGTYGSSRSIATFKDDARFAGPGTVTIGTTAGATTTTLARTSGNATSSGGTPLTFTATVVGNSPTGNVIFYDGLISIGTSTLNGSFQATLTTSDLTAGVHTITALYGGNAGNPSSSGSLTQTMVETRTLATNTSLALTNGVNPSTNGASVTFTASVVGSSPSGSVQFYDGSTPLGTTSLNGSGQASITTNGLAVGWRAITARYLGSTTHLPSRTATAFFLNVNPPAGNGKLKVFILAGQSNMVGKGEVEFGRDPSNSAGPSIVGGLGSLRNMLNRSPEKYGYLADPANPTAQGNPGFLKRSDVWVTYTGEPAAPGRSGILDANFGNLGGQGLIGPEYGFGLIAASQFADPVLIIKIAWGGKSLKVDFRPPSSVASTGIYGGGTLGPYYTLMIDRVRAVLNNLPATYPGYNGAGYEVAGFGWHQGWNDIGQATAEYEGNLVNLIKDIRTEFGKPSLPVVIAASGMASGAAGNVLTAQLNVGNPVLHPEFTGTVTSVDTRPFDYGILLGVRDDVSHWYLNGESYFNIGDSMGQAMMSIIQPASSAKDILTFGISGQTSATISGTNINVIMPAGTNVTNLAPTYTVSSGASGSPVSGIPRNFTTPQSYTITAQDLTTKVYTVTLAFASSNSTFTWATQSMNGDWGTAARWMENVAPVPNGSSSYVFNFNVGGTYTANNNLTAGFQLNRMNFGGSTVTVTGNLLALTANGATLPTISQTSTSPVIISAPVNLLSNVTVGGTATGEMTFASALSGSGSLTKTSSGNMTLSGANSYSGGTAINGGTLTLANQAGLGSGPLTLAAGTSFQQSNFEGNYPGGAIPNSCNLTGSGYVTINIPFSQKDIWLSQVVSGTGGLAVQGGTRSITLTAANTFSGGVRLTNADNRVQISHLRALGIGTFRSLRTVENSGQLIPLANLSTAPGVANAFDIDSGAYLNVFADGANNLLLSGPITNTVGSGNLYKSGSATLTLSGVNTYTGSTKIAAGTLACNSAEALSMGSIVILNGGKLNLIFSSTRQVRSLTLGTTIQGVGTYGSRASSATYRNDTYFSGPGVINVTSTDVARMAAAQSASVNNPPVFMANPTVMGGANESVAYSGQTLAGKATDVDAGDILIYSKVSGPAWLAVANNGTLSGTPPAGSAGLHSFIVRATDSLSAIADVGLQITVTGLPMPWVMGSIGSGMLTGSTSYSGGTFSQSGSGALGATSDKLNFSYQTLTGDGEIVARIGVLQDTGTLSGVGVMIRETLATNSKHVFMGMTGSNTYLTANRITTGGASTTSTAGTATVPNTWVKLVRLGNVITAYKSMDGTAWTSTGSTTETMASSCYIGLAVSSGNDTILNRSQFTNLSVTP
jgi:autotransporter-associated beta strand protein